MRRRLYGTRWRDDVHSLFHQCARYIAKLLFNQGVILSLDSMPDYEREAIYDEYKILMILGGACKDRNCTICSDNWMCLGHQRVMEYLHY